MIFHVMAQAFRLAVLLFLHPESGDLCVILAAFLLFRADRLHSEKVAARREHGQGGQDAQFPVAEKLVVIDAQAGAASDQNAVGGAPVGDVDHRRDSKERGGQDCVPFPAFIEKQDVKVQTDPNPAKNKKDHGRAETEDQDGFRLTQKRRLDMPYRMQDKERKAGQKGFAEICRQRYGGDQHRSRQQFFRGMRPEKEKDGSQKEEVLQQDRKDVGTLSGCAGLPEQMKSGLTEEKADRECPSTVPAGLKMLPAEPVDGPYGDHETGQQEKKFFHRIPPFFLMQASSSAQKSSYLLLAMGIRSPLSRRSS